MTASHLRTLLRPWSVHALAIEAGRWLISHGTPVISDVACYMGEAQRLRSRLLSVSGIDVLPTSTNFMLCRIARHRAQALKDYLASEHHLLIRDASNFEGLDEHYFRVAAQTPEEDDALVEAISRFMGREQEG